MTVKNPSITLDKTALTLAVGETGKLNATTAPKSAASTVAYTSDKPEIATVANDGTVTAVGAGEATITASAKCGTETRTATAKVTVKKLVFESVKQTKADVVEAVVKGATKENIKSTSDVKISNKANNNVIGVKSVSVDDKDATKVTITTHAPMKDGGIYVVEIDGTAKEFTATDGVVADVNVTPVEIPANTEGTEIKGQTIDKNGVIIDEFNKTQAAGISAVDFTLTTRQGYVDGDKLVLSTVGYEGEAEVTYHTFKYENGKETGAINKKVKIVAVADTPVTVEGFKYTVGDSGPTDWKNLTVNKTFSVSDTNAKAYFKFENSKGTDVTSDYKVVTSDPSVFMLPKTQASNAGVKVIGVKEGSAYINVEDKDGKVVASLPVEVTAARKLANVKLFLDNKEVANPVVTVINTTDPDSQAELEIKAYDQFGKKIEAADLTSATPTPSGTATGITVNAASKEKAVISTSSAAAGSYVYTLEVKKGDDSFKASFTVRVVQTSKTIATATDLRLELSGNVASSEDAGADAEVDMSVSATDNATSVVKTVTAKLAAYDQGAKLGYVSDATYKINGATLEAYATESSGVLTINVVTCPSTDVTKNLEAGKNYTIQATSGNKAATKVLKAKDSNGEGIANVTKTTFTGTVTGSGITVTEGDAQAILEQCVEVTYNGVTYKGNTDSGSYKAIDVVGDADGKFYDGGKSVYIKSVKIKVSNGTLNYTVPVTIDRTFTN